MFSIEAFLGSSTVKLADSSQLAIADDEMEITIGRQIWDRRMVWLRYSRKTGEYRIAFSNKYGAEEEHLLGVLTP